jgi:WD40 repeat protein
MNAFRLGFVGGLVASSLFGATTDTKKVTYEDDVLPILRDNCLKCHNPDKLKGDLDLTSFSAAIKGGGSGATLNAGDPDGSQLFKSITHTDEPSMPPNAKLGDKDIATIKKWIEGGLLQGAGSKALAANKPAVDLSLKSVSVGKPDGPPPMPGKLALEPFVRAQHGTALTAIANSPWAPVVALAGARQIVLYNTSDLEFMGVLSFPEGLPCDVKFSRTGKLLLASGGRGGHSGLVVVWDIATGERVMSVGDQFDSVLAADISSDQRWIALGGPDRVLKIYNTKEGALEHRIKKHTEWVTAVEFSPDSKYLATGDRNGGVVLWEAESGREMFTLPGHKGAITAISWRGDSEMFLSASEDGTLKLWKATDGSALRSIPAHTGGALSARFTHDGRVVSCGRDNKVQIWDAAGKNVRSLAFSGDLPNRVTFTDVGKKVIASDWKGSVFVWDAKTGKVIGELDSNPPTLAERVQHSAQLIATLQAEVDASLLNRVKSEGDAGRAQVNVEKLKKALADANDISKMVDVEGQKRRERLAGNAEKSGDEPAGNPASDGGDAMKRLQAQIAALQKDLTQAKTVADAAAKKAKDANATLEASTAKLEAAKASLTKWKAVLQTTQATARNGNVSLR